MCGVTLSKSFLLWWINIDICPLQKISQVTKQDGGETLGDVELIYPFPIITGGLYRAQILFFFFRKTMIRFQLCKWIHPSRGCDTEMYVGSLWIRSFFFYGESPRTPPLEGTSLHRRHNSVERPWGILSLFTTCFRLRVNSPCQRL